MYDDANIWAPTTQMGDQEEDPGSWFQPVPALDSPFWEWINARKSYLFLFLLLLLSPTSLCLSNKTDKTFLKHKNPIKN